MASLFHGEDILSLQTPGPRDWTVFSTPGLLDSARYETEWTSLTFLVQAALYKRTWVFPRATAIPQTTDARSGGFAAAMRGKKHPFSCFQDALLNSVYLAHTDSVGDTSTALTYETQHGALGHPKAEASAFRREY